MGQLPIPPVKRKKNINGDDAVGALHCWFKVLVISFLIFLGDLDRAMSLDSWEGGSKIFSGTVLVSSEQVRLFRATFTGKTSDKVRTALYGKVILIYQSYKT